MHDLSKCVCYFDAAQCSGVSADGAVARANTAYRRDTERLSSVLGNLTNLQQSSQLQ